MIEGEENEKKKNNKWSFFTVLKPFSFEIFVMFYKLYH